MNIFRKNVAPFKYYSDGTGRDGYVLHEHGGLERNYKPLKNYHLKDFLRTPESGVFNFKADPLKEGVAVKTLYVSKKEFDRNQSIKALEKNIVRRLYYSEKHKFLGNKEKAPKKYTTMLRSYEDFPTINSNIKQEKDTFKDPDKFSDIALKLGRYDNIKLSSAERQLQNLTKRYLNKSANITNMKVFSTTGTNFNSK